MAAQGRGSLRKPLAVPFRVGIPSLDTQAQGTQNRLSSFEFICELLQPEERFDPSKQLGGKDRFIQEVVGPGFNTSDLVLAVAQTGNKQERDQAGGWIFLHLMAEFVPRAA